MSSVSVTCIRDGGVTGRRQAWCGVSAVPKSAWAELKGKNVGLRWRKTETRGDSDEKQPALGLLGCHLEETDVAAYPNSMIHPEQIGDRLHVGSK